MQVSKFTILEIKQSTLFVWICYDVYFISWYEQHLFYTLKDSANSMAFY